MNFKTKNKLVIGLTGSMLTGKSTVLEAFDVLGALTLSADELVHEELESPAVRKQLIARFKTEDRTRIARKVFNSPADRKWLEALVHPKVTQKISGEIKKSKKKVVVVEAPVLFEAGLKGAFDLTLLVVADEAQQIRRATARGISKTDFLKRIKAQLKQEDKMKLADIIIANTSSKEDLANKVKNLCRVLQNLWVNQIKRS